MAQGEGRSRSDPEQVALSSEPEESGKGCVRLSGVER